MAGPDDNPTPDQDDIDPQAMVDQMLSDAQSSVDDLSQQAADVLGEAEAGETGGSAPVSQGIDLLNDVDLHVSIELGRTRMLVEDVLRLQSSSVVELDKLAGDPVDVYVNDRLVARGEVLVLNDNFCIRVSEIVSDLDEESLTSQSAA